MRPPFSRRNRQCAFLFVLCQSIWATSACAEGDYPVAGLTPSLRPAGAPAIARFEQTAEWRARGLKGISEPHPQGLGFLEYQGAWYSPFDRPGLTGPYDLRGWHVTKPPVRKEARP